MKHFRLFDTNRSNVLPFLFAVVTGLLLSGLAQADPLTDDRIQSFIDSLSDTKKLGEEYPDLERENDGPPKDMTRPLSSSLEERERHPEAEAKLEDLVQDHGFESVREWAETGDRIYVAMIAIGIREMPAEQREMMRNTPELDLSEGMYANMPEAQKAKLKQTADSMRGALEAADNAPEADIEAVRPFRSQLKTMMGD